MLFVPIHSNASICGMNMNARKYRTALNLFFHFNPKKYSFNKYKAVYVFLLFRLFYFEICFP